jgi:RNA polymerase sigma-70 factor (ECF subfamily)
MNDDEVARLAEQAKTDPQAFGRLYDEYMPEVYGYIMRRVMNKETAEDLTSQAFEKALKSIRGLRPGVPFNAWLFKIAGNIVIDHFRTTGRQQTYSLTEAGYVVNGNSAKAVQQVDNKLAVMSLLNKLPDSHREVITKHFLDGMSMDELAQDMKTSTSTAYMKVYRATKAFTELLERHGITRIDDYVQA